MTADEHGGIDGTCGFSGCGKGACEDEDQAHEHDIGFTHTLGEDVGLLCEALLAVEEEGGGRGYQEGGWHRNAIEVARPDGEA